MGGPQGEGPFRVTMDEVFGNNSDRVCLVDVTKKRKKGYWKRHS